MTREIYDKFWDKEIDNVSAASRRRNAVRDLILHGVQICDEDGKDDDSGDQLSLEEVAELRRIALGRWQSPFEAPGINKSVLRHCLGQRVKSSRRYIHEHKARGSTH